MKIHHAPGQHVNIKKICVGSLWLSHGVTYGVRMSQAARLEGLVQQCNQLTVIFPIAFLRRTPRYKIILKSYKTQKHNSVIEQCTIDFNQTISTSPWQKRGNRTVWLAKNTIQQSEVKRVFPLKNHSPTTREEETAEKKKNVYIPFSEMYLSSFLQQAPPTAVLIGCPSN